MTEANRLHADGGSVAGIANVVCGVGPDFQNPRENLLAYDHRRFHQHRLMVVLLQMAAQYLEYFDSMGGRQMV